MDLRYFNQTGYRDGPVTHQSLDAVADGHVADHLRALLVAHGVLAVRHEQLAQIE